MHTQDSNNRVTLRRVRLIRKVADYLNGIDVSRHNVGDVFDLHPLEAELLIAEGWAVPEYTIRAAHDRRTGGERRRPAAAAPGDDNGSEPAAPRRSVARLRADRTVTEQQRAAADERRRAEVEIREELRDSRAKTLGNEPKEPTP